MVPYAVSLVTDPCDVPGNTLRVIQSSMSKLYNHTFGVCVPAFHSQFNDVHKLVEVVEVNRIFGARHFIFYNLSIGSDVDTLLRSYIKDGLAEVVQWKLPEEVLFKIHYLGQLVAINDCLYRLSGRAGNILFADLDEFAVPRIHNNWAELIENVTNNGTITKYGAFQIRSTVFPISIHENTSKEHQHIPESILRVNRSAFIFSRSDRSKYISIARKIDTAGIHYVWSFVGKYRTIFLNETIALLHHYRANLPTANESFIIDDNMHRFSEKLIPAISDRFKRVNMSFI